MISYSMQCLSFGFQVLLLFVMLWKNLFLHLCNLDLLNMDLYQVYYFEYRNYIFSCLLLKDHSKSNQRYQNLLHLDQLSLRIFLSILGILLFHILLGSHHHKQYFVLQKLDFLIDLYLILFFLLLEFRLKFFLILFFFCINDIFF